MKTLGLVLGGGGARALAQLAVLEALDEIGVRPAAIAGVSLGALIGAAYSAGMTAKAIRRAVIAVAHNRSETWSRLLGARATAWTAMFKSGFNNPVVLDAEKFIEAFMPEAIPPDFDDLAIPLTVVATDLYGRCERALSEGPLRPAVAASLAVPGLLRPVALDGRILVDGAAVNPLPFDHLLGKAEVVVAVDCAGVQPPEGTVPDPWEATFATLQVMGHLIQLQKRGAPDLTIRPNVGIFRMLDFFQASAIIRAAEPVKAEVQEQIAKLLA